MEHYDTENTAQHFFASTGLGWAVAESPIEAWKKALAMGGTTNKKHGPIYGGIWHVPLPIEASYQIRYYSPQVEGCTKIWEGNGPVIR